MKTKSKNGTWFGKHSHAWIVIFSAIILVIAYINVLPNEKIFPSVLMGLIVSHVIIIIISLFGIWLAIPEKIQKVFKRKKTKIEYDFGWSVKWRKGLAIASCIVLILAFYSYFALFSMPIGRVVIFTALLLLSVNLFIGNIITNSDPTLTLPFGDLLRTGNRVLDAGCGAGRTTVAIGKAMPEAQIVSLDRFDASYIENGGLNLFNINIEIARISDRVEIKQGDITAIPFDESQIDAVVSSYVFDHMGKQKLAALKETYRVLKPGGRFLLIILVRGYSSFGVANILSLFILRVSKWKKLFSLVNFTIIDEGIINSGSYFLLEKPLNR